MAEEVIRRASRDNPADTALRKLFGAQRDLPPEVRTEIAQSVFRWFRWFGWLNKQESIERGLIRAAELDSVFQADPARMPATELVPRAIPGWTRGHLERDPDWVRALQHHPRLWLRARPGQAAALAVALGDCQPGPAGFPDTLEYTGPHDLFHTKEFKAGAFEIEPAAADKKYVKAVNKGVVKVLSKIGISTIRSYLGAQQSYLTPLLKKLVASSGPMAGNASTGCVSSTGPARQISRA